jgi:hypothetical protein
VDRRVVRQVERRVGVDGAVAVGGVDVDGHTAILASGVAGSQINERAGKTVLSGDVTNLTPFVDGGSRGVCKTPLGFGFGRFANPGCAARPWALEWNAFDVRIGIRGGSAGVISENQTAFDRK